MNRTRTLEIPTAMEKNPYVGNFNLRSVRDRKPGRLNSYDFRRSIVIKSCYMQTNSEVHYI